MPRAVLAFALLGCACQSDAPETAPVSVTITATVDSTRVDTREHMLAAGEMQISGEPLAEAMGRVLSNYSRYRVPGDLYFDPQMALSWIDPAGYSTGIESYEYSKQPMNNLMFESGAGTSLAYGPLVNTDNAVGSAATAHLAALVQQIATAANTRGRFVFTEGTYPTSNASGNVNPTGAGLPANNPLGWPGLWPTAHVFASFDPTIDPTQDVGLSCAISSDDNPGSLPGITVTSADYECDATSLHLRDRSAQIEPTLTPGADGFSAWKYGLWVLNYLEVMHDTFEGPVSSVDDGDLATVGAPGNAIIGADEDGIETRPGTYLGPSDIEGFQAQMFIASVDNRAADWLAQLTTADGTTLSGFASVAAAIEYSYDAPLRWFPSIHVTEADDGGVFPRPAYTLASATSDLLDTIGLAMGYAEFYALTDTTNVNVGGSQAAIAVFDGAPFAGDNGLADGEASLHDRALGIMRVALVDLDRLHTDPTTGILVDTVTFDGAVPARGRTLSTTSLAYTLLGLRTVLRSLGGQLELYSNNAPDTAISHTPLDAVPLHYPDDAALTLSGRLEQMLRVHAALLYDDLTDASGRAFSGWDVVANAPIDRSDTLDAHAAAVRGLFAAYLATGDVRYRDRAVAVFDRMEAVFFDRDARIYTVTPAPADTVEYTPVRFALVQSTLRDMYELIARRPGEERRIAMLEDRLARIDKLVLNGWDDRDQNRIVDYPNECVRVVDGIPRGGLQNSERTLTGEIGSLQAPLVPGEVRTPSSDRDRDCVPEIDDAHLPAGLAGSITFHLSRS
jgi:hypothetical protein